MQAYLPARLPAVLSTLLIGLAAALLCQQINTPLPWLIGPLFATAVACMSGMQLHCPIALRQVGQWGIGTALGLYFTPAVVVVLVSYLGFIGAGVTFSLLLGMACGWCLHRLAHVDQTTAFFAMAVGGASEMATQGERYGARVDRVAAAHSLRIMLVVAVIPFGFRLWNIHGLDPFVPGISHLDYGGLVLLIALTSGGALALRHIRTPNAWVIGPLLVAAGLTASDISLSSLPEWIVRMCQLFIGISLGTRFSPGFLRAAPRYMAGVALCSLLAMALAAGFALLLARFSGLHPATLILATSPGGIAEMSLTAKTLQLGVPIVTAFHVARMAVLVLVIGPLFRGARWFKRRWRNK